MARMMKQTRQRQIYAFPDDAGNVRYFMASDDGLVPFTGDPGLIKTGQMEQGGDQGGWANYSYIDETYETPDPSYAWAEAHGLVPVLEAVEAKALHGTPIPAHIQAWMDSVAGRDGDQWSNVVRQIQHQEDPGSGFSSAMKIGDIFNPSTALGFMGLTGGQGGFAGAQLATGGNTNDVVKGAALDAAALGTGATLSNVLPAVGLSAPAGVAPEVGALYSGLNETSLADIFMEGAGVVAPTAPAPAPTDFSNLTPGMGNVPHPAGTSFTAETPINSVTGLPEVTPGGVSTGVTNLPTAPAPLPNPAGPTLGNPDPNGSLITPTTTIDPGTGLPVPPVAPVPGNSTNVLSTGGEGEGTEETTTTTTADPGLAALGDYLKQYLGPVGLLVAGLSDDVRQLGGSLINPNLENTGVGVVPYSNMTGEQNQVLQAGQSTLAGQKNLLDQQFNQYMGVQPEALNAVRQAPGIDPTILEGFANRTRAALAGGLPDDPALLRTIQEQQLQTEARLRGELGTGYATSTPGIQALADWDKRKAELLYAARQNDLTNTFNSYLQGTNAGVQQGALRGKTLADIASGGLPFINAGTAIGTAQQQPFNALTTQQMNNAALNQKYFQNMIDYRAGLLSTLANVFGTVYGNKTGTSGSTTRTGSTGGSSISDFFSGDIKKLFPGGGN